MAKIGQLRGETGALVWATGNEVLDSQQPKASSKPWLAWQWPKLQESSPRQWGKEIELQT